MLNSTKQELSLAQEGVANASCKLNSTVQAERVHMTVALLSWYLTARCLTVGTCWALLSCGCRSACLGASLRGVVCLGQEGVDLGSLRGRSWGRGPLPSTASSSAGRTCTTGQTSSVTILDNAATAIISFRICLLVIWTIC